ncbi:TonB-dependent receptor plug domain-containing protein [Xanthovirga aplysinae]|uniref:TonB-dependent receptor plug domain-containing protein n=1 Tax=Xanthovirga aplysinae TaxID=2529853 RepID=UPI0012BC7D32|nr:TonB-dependent receptor [Xanthovirga aplysinae]MTI31355.1 hypothetical protein [Xanthovirga aplysinae]
MRYFFCLLFTIIVFPFLLFGQQMQVGELLDPQGVKIEGALLITSNQQTISDENGNFSLQINSYPLNLEVFHINYKPKVIKLNQVLKDTLSIILVESADTLSSIEIKGKKMVPKNLEANFLELDIKSLQKRPHLFGEFDILRVLQKKAGVTNISEVDGGYYVRGSSNGQNQIHLDGAPVYYANHLMGINSTFNGDIIESATLQKGNFHARQGGALASFLEVNSKRGSLESYSLRGGLSLLSSRLAFEGPISKNKASFSLGIRKSYYDLISKSYNNINEGKEGFSPLPNFNFYDVNGKVFLKPSTKNHLVFSYFRSKDGFSINDPNNPGIGLDWANNVINLEWVYIMNKKWRAHFNSSYSNFGFLLDFQTLKAFNAENRTSSINNQVEFNFEPHTNFSLDIGSFFSKSFYLATTKELQNDLLNFKNSDLEEQSTYYGIYFQSRYLIDEDLEFSTGLRVNAFYSDLLFSHLSPRLAVKYRPASNWIIHADWSRNFQYHYLFSLLSINLPADIRMPSTVNLPVQSADLFSIGTSLSLNQQLQFNANTYYKSLQNQIVYENGGSLNFDKLQENLLIGKGWAYGTEISLKAKNKYTSLDINYTWSNTWRQFEGINEGKAFHPVYDIRHFIYINSLVKINTHLSFGLNWFYNTGAITTFPTGYLPLQNFNSTSFQPSITPLFEERNNFRMPPSHRLDIAANYSWQSKKEFKSTITVGIYNVYNQANPYFVYFSVHREDRESLQVIPKKKALLPLFPTISYSFQITK